MRAISCCCFEGNALHPKHTSSPVVGHRGESAVLSMQIARSAACRPSLKARRSANVSLADILYSQMNLAPGLLSRSHYEVLTLRRFPMSRVNEPRASEPGPYVFRGVVEAAIATAPVARAAATL